MFIAYGKRKFLIRIFEPLFYKCPFCETRHTTEVFIYSYYFHILWIPVFPIRKIASAKCTECDTLRSEERFGPKLVDHVNEELKNVKHPFYSWTFLVLFGALILLIIIITSTR